MRLFNCRSMLRARPVRSSMRAPVHASESLYPATLGKPNSFPFSYYSESGNLDADYFSRLKTSPFLDELTFGFARAAVEGEGLGNNPAGVPDLLGISLSAHDYVNHAFGPESKMSHDHLQRLDRMIASFFLTLISVSGWKNNRCINCRPRFSERPRVLTIAACRCSAPGRR